MIEKVTVGVIVGRHSDWESFVADSYKKGIVVYAGKNVLETASTIYHRIGSTEKFRGMKLDHVTFDYAIHMAPGKLDELKLLAASRSR